MTSLKTSIPIKRSGSPLFVDKKDEGFDVPPVDFDAFRNASGTFILSHKWRFRKWLIVSKDAIDSG
jgi:hypothetical protein